MRLALGYGLSFYLLVASFATQAHAYGGGKGAPVRFDYTAAQIAELCRTEQAKLQARLRRIAALSPEAAVFKTTAAAIEDAFGDFSAATNHVTFLEDVAPAREVRDAAQDCSSQVSRLYVDAFARSDLYDVLKEAKAKNEALDAQDEQLLDEYLKSFRRNGLELAPEKLAQLTELKKRIVDLQTEHSRNLAEWDDFLAVTREQLAGMSEDYIKGLETTPEGLYKLTLDYPTYFPFVENATDAATRQALEYKYNRRGGERNKELLTEAVKLRAEMAKLLGYENHAAFVLEERMAKNPATVNAFLKDLEAKLLPKGRQEMAELVELKRETTGDESADRINSWDWRYYHTLLIKNRYQVDQEKIREYFPLDAVLSGMFDIYQQLLGVKFVALPKANKWHDDVRAYAVVDPKTSATISYFYMDLFPREGKYGHAAAFTLVEGRSLPTRYQKPVSSIVANFAKPSEANPSLLAHDEVETLFHEFGHIMHQVLTKARYASFSGTSVRLDFVEAPSQMLENWVWQKESLAKLSRHYKTGEALPDDLLDKMLAAKRADVALLYLRQLMFAEFDMAIHSDDDGVVDTTDVYARLGRDVALIPIQAGTLPEASFGHVMGGYDAGYYGYLWSKVYAQDMFTRFEREGLLNPSTGAAYRHNILEPGGTQEPLELITAFLGREPNSEAFLRSLGISW